MRPIPATMRDQTEFLPLGLPLRTRERPPVDVVKLEAAEFEMYDASHVAPDAVWDQCVDEWVHRDHVTSLCEVEIGQVDRFTIHADTALYGGNLTRERITKEINQDVFLRAGQQLDANARAPFAGNDDYPVPYEKLFKGEVGLYAEFRAEMAAASRVDAAKALNRIEAAERVANLLKPPQAASPELAAAIEGAQRAMLAHFFGTCPQVGEGPNGPSSATGMMLMQEQANREMRAALCRVPLVSFAQSQEVTARQAQEIRDQWAGEMKERWNGAALARKLGLD